MIRKKSTKAYSGKIPFSLDGKSQLHWPEDQIINFDKWDSSSKIGELTQEYIDNQKYYGEPPKPYKYDFSSEEYDIQIFQNHYDKKLINVRGIRWVNNYVFSDYLRFISFQRGRSAAYAIFLGNKSNYQYTMFLSDLELLINTKDMSHGLVFGNFTFCKRGVNYGTKVVD